MSEFWYRAVVISVGIVSAALMATALFDGHSAVRELTRAGHGGTNADDNRGV